jgi:hypothetical protein
MIKKRLIILLLVLSAMPLVSKAEVFFSASSDVYTRYIFRGFTPAGNQPALGLNVSAFFSDINLNLSQWYVNSLSDISAYHELGTMASYYHYFNDRLIGSGGLTIYLYPNVPLSPLAGVEASLTLADVGFVIPYFIETYFDFVLKSWYARFTAGYTIDTFLPFNFTVSAGANLLSYQHYGINVPAGFSDLSLQLSTFISLKKWQISPKFSCIFPHRSIYPKTMLQASVNLAYSF